MERHPPSVRMPEKTGNSLPLGEGKSVFDERAHNDAHGE